MEISGGNIGGIQASLSGRYATALFELARDAKSLAEVESSLATLRRALDGSEDFRRLTTSPLVGRAEAGRAVAALAADLGIDGTSTRFLGVLAQNRRLGQLGAIIRDFGRLLAAHRGETSAQVTSAHALDAGQVAELKAQLRKRVGRDVALELDVDPSLLGGIVVRIGSLMIDSSIRTRLNSLAHAMKG